MVQNCLIWVERQNMEFHMEPAYILPSRTYNPIRLLSSWMFPVRYLRFRAPMSTWSFQTPGFQFRVYLHTKIYYSGGKKKALKVLYYIKLQIYFHKSNFKLKSELYFKAKYSCNASVLIPTAAKQQQLCCQLNTCRSSQRLCSEGEHVGKQSYQTMAAVLSDWCHLSFRRHS